ncbi:MAG: hypothetical protein KDD92_02925 [Caldilineaceae bacterium]|nr:hypothetical protein [Caldilineaceae bacterium]
MYRRTPVRVIFLTLLLFFAFSTLAVSLLFSAAQAAPSPKITISGPVLQGMLISGERHYLSVEPTQSDGLMILTLAYEPLNTDLQGLINFLVLDEDQLRRFVAGDLNVRTANIASGALLQFDPAGNKMRAAFRGSGHGAYTVIVYNDADIFATYTLEAIGGRLSDGINQTTLPAPAAPVPATPAPAPTETSEASSGGFHTVMTTTVTGELVAPITRHYLTIDPTIRDSRITLNMNYAPESDALDGFVNFVVLTEDGLQRLLRGENIFDLELATGAPVPFVGHANQLTAEFRASGNGPYTAVLYNGAAEPVTYTFSTRNAQIIDRYGQTNESKGAPATPATTATPAATATITSTTANFAPNRNVLLTGLLDQPYEHHYYGLFPNVRDTRVIVTLDYDPRGSDALRDNVNFWVLDEDGLRRVIAGARPEDVEIASGALIPFGVDENKLRGVFKASGRGEYTVIVYNNSEEAAVYSLRVRGGELEDLSKQATSLGTLP